MTDLIISDRLFKQCLVGLLVAALGFLYIGQYTDLDLRLADWMYDFDRKAFQWNGRWLADTFMHHWLKYLFIALGVALTALFCVDTLPSLRRLPAATRRKLAVVVIACIMVPVVVSLLKSRSALHCPYEIDRYGGSAPFVRLLEHVPAGLPAGHCFPAGHASGGLWLAAFAVFWLPQRPRRAAAVFALGLLPGLAMGWAQQLRGAHFLTHTLWSVWIASILILLIARILPSVWKN
jgi:membrane-associated PAP2 superfamily phosphatase